MCRAIHPSCSAGVGPHGTGPSMSPRKTSHLQSPGQRPLCATDPGAPRGLPVPPRDRQGLHPSGLSPPLLTPLHPPAPKTNTNACGFANSEKHRQKRKLPEPRGAARERGLFWGRSLALSPGTMVQKVQGGSQGSAPAPTPAPPHVVSMRLILRRHLVRR